MKVMHIVARLNIGGVALYVAQLAAQQRETGLHSQIVCGQVGKNEGDMAYVAEAQNVPITYINSLGREISPTGDLLTLFRLWRLIHRENPDVVHTHTAKAGFVGRVAAWLAGVPVIVHTFHGHVFNGYFGPPKTRLFLALERLCARLSSRIITLSASLKRELCEVYRIAPETKFAVIELGFDLDTLSHTKKGQTVFRAKYGIPPDVPLVGIVGRLVPVKNHRLFLEAAQRVLDVVPEAWFAIIGDGELRAELEVLAQSLGLPPRLVFTGWIKETQPVYAALDVLVLCSHNEGLPVSLIEAMAAGVPVVSTAVGGAPDLLEGGVLGGLVPPGDCLALAREIVNALHCSPARIEAAHDAALERYSIRASAARTEALYRQLLADRA